MLAIIRFARFLIFAIILIFNANTKTVLLNVYL